MKKVLFLAPIEPNGRFNGGINSYATSICSDPYLENNGVKLIPLSTSRIKRDAYSGGKFTFKNIKNFFAVKKALKNKLREEKFDAIYINSSRNYALFKDLLLFKKKYKKSYDTILHIHFAEYDEVFPNNRLIRKKCLSIIKKRLTKVIVLSEELKKQLVAKGVDENKIFVLRNYFDQNLSSRSMNEIDKLKEHSPIKYVFVGSITLRKGIDCLLSAFSKLDDTYHLDVCGTPNDVNGDKLLEQYKNLSNVSFLGFVKGKQKNNILNSADVFVLPTLAEGLPISILEAMNAGLAIITTRVGAIPEIIKENNGFVISPSNEDELLESIKFYHDNFDTLKEHMKNNLLESNKYSYDNFRKSFINIVK